MSDHYQEFLFTGVEFGQVHSDGSVSFSIPCRPVDPSIIRDWLDDSDLRESEREEIMSNIWDVFRWSALRNAATRHK